MLFNYELKELDLINKLHESYEYAIYCHKIREALKELANALEENNKLLTESDEDITKAINFLVPKLRYLANISDNNTLFIEMETLFKKTPEDYLVYLGVVLTSFLKNIPDKTYVDIYKHSQNFTYETGVFYTKYLFECVNEKFQFFFILLNSKKQPSILIRNFWNDHKIVNNISKITFIPNNNNDITLNIIKGNKTFMFRGLKENRSVSNFIYELLKDNPNLIEAINSHLNKQFSLDMKIISPYYSFL